MKAKAHGKLPNMVGATSIFAETEAEKRLIEGAKLGERVVFGDGDRPIEAAKENTVRAELIRALLLDLIPDVSLHAKGIRVRGAFISGHLDMQGSSCGYDLTLSRSSFEKAPSFVNASMQGLHLSGCACPGLIADSAKFDGSVFLRSGFEASGEISLPGARISGDLQICDAKIQGAQNMAIFAPSIKVDGSIYLGDYPFDEADSELIVEGACQFSAAIVTRDFICKNCSFSPVDSAAIAQFQIETGAPGIAEAISLNRAEIGGVLYLKNIHVHRGLVNLAGAVARRLNDEPNGEDVQYLIRLDGFEYSGFSDEADTRLTSRLNWIERRPESLEFSAQPYEHLATTLNRLGHRNDAQDVLWRKEHMQRQANIKTIKQSRVGIWRVPFLRFSDLLMRYLVGYGYKPTNALIWGLVFIAAMAVLAQKTWDAGDMAPNAAPILISKGWIEATEEFSGNPAQAWAKPGAAGQDYETFNSIAYAADLFIPIVNLGQESAWAPSTSRSPLGRITWWVRWFAKIIGWVITALGAAAVTGVIRRL